MPLPRADNISYDTAGFFAGTLGDNSWAAVLRSRKSVCAGYAGLFAEMCRRAGIEVREISGFAKGYGYDSTGKLSAKPDHAWNAVRIRGQWHLVDATWDSGSVSASRAWRKEYATDYLFLEPAAFIYTHLPEQGAAQLLDRPITLTEYEAMPWLNGAFFKYGLKLLTPGIGCAVQSDGTLRLEFVCPEDVVLDGHLEDAKGAPLEGTAFATREGGVTRLAFAAPDAGTWTARVFARFNRKPLRPFEGVLTFRLRSAQGAGTRPAFPLLYATYYSLNCQLMGPIDGVLPKGSTREFRIRVPGATGVFLREGKRMIGFENHGDGMFTLSHPVPAEAELHLYVQLPGSRGYSGLLRYLVR